MLAAIAGSSMTLWDVTDPSHPARTAALPTGATAVMSGSFSSDGHTLAAAVGPQVGNENGNYLVQLWNVTDAHHPTVAATLPDTHAFAVAFSPSSPLLAVGGSNVGTHLWDTTNPAQPVQIDTSPTVLGANTTVAALAFTRDGRNLAMGADDRHGDRVEVDDVSDPRTPRVISRYSMPTLITSVAFGNDHQDVFASGAENAIRFWHPAPAATMRDINAIAVEKVKYSGFTPDSRILALPTDPTDTKILTALDGQEFRLWRISAAGDATPAGTLTTASLASQMIAVNNHTLLEAAPNHPARLWDVSDPVHPNPGATLNNLQPSKYGGTGDVATNGQITAVNGDDGLVHLWDLTNPRAPAPLSTVPRTDNFLGTNLGDDGHTLYVIDAAGAVHIWDITNPRRPAEASQINTGSGTINILTGQIDHAPGTHSVLALKTTTLNPGAIQLWDLSDIRHPVRVDTPSLVAHTFLMSLDGRTLAITTGNTVELWDITDIRHPARTASLPAVAQAQLAFSPDNHTLASTTGFDIIANHNTTSEIHLWNVADPGDPVDIGTPAVPGSVASLNFSPDGANLLIAGSGFEELSIGGGGARLLNTDIDHLTKRLCDLVGGTLTPDQWQQHFPGTPFTPSCA
jgi:WD40 repeat protein